MADTPNNTSAGNPLQGILGMFGGGANAGAATEGASSIGKVALILFRLLLMRWVVFLALPILHKQVKIIEIVLFTTVALLSGFIIQTLLALQRRQRLIM